MHKKNYFKLSTFCCLLFSSLLPVYADSDTDIFFEQVKKDYIEFYSSERLYRAAVVFAGSAVVANTNIDQYIQDSYQNDTRSEATDDFSKIAKNFGEGKYLITLSLATVLTSSYLETSGHRSAVGRWGQRSLRAYLVGGPATLLTQQMTGASRPGETNNDSKWKPFLDSNGVSGHAFIGAVPFLTIARMNNDNKFIKYLFYTASTFSAFSRVNDNSHYFSQAVLGWYLAFEATDTVFDNDIRDQSVAFRPYIGNDQYGIVMNVKW